MRTFYSVVEHLINKALQFDAGAPNRLRQLKGKSLDLRILDVPIRVHVVFTEQGISLASLGSNDLTVSNTTIKAPPICSAFFGYHQKCSKRHKAWSYHGRRHRHRPGNTNFVLRIRS